MNFVTGELFRNIGGIKSGIVIEGETLKKCQKVILSMAEDFISMCEKEGIFYELGGGSCLGAVREKGFIPWDDDMDINVLSRDFGKIGSLMAKHYGDKYSFVDYRNNFHYVFGKIMLNNTLFVETATASTDKQGFYIDIFQIENVPDNSILRKIHGALCMVAGGLLSCRRIYECKELCRELIKNTPSFKNVIRVKLFIGWCMSFMNTSVWAKITRYIYELCKNENSKYVSIPGGRRHYFNEMHTREGLTETITAEFEGHHWQIPKDYKAYLNALYGQSYMTPPPSEMREHHIIFELKFPDGSTK